MEQSVNTGTLTIGLEEGLAMLNNRDTSNNQQQVLLVVFDVESADTICQFTDEVENITLILAPIGFMDTFAVLIIIF